MGVNAGESPQVRGTSTLSNRAPLSLGIPSLLIDLCFLLSIYALGIQTRLWGPLLDTSPHRLKFLGALLLANGIFILIWRATLGQRIARLGWKNGRLIQKQALDTPQKTMILIIALLSAGASGFHLIAMARFQPAFFQADAIQIPSFIPDAPGWTTLPFYYALGGWPTQFQNQPLYYETRYEKGPPVQFLGRVIIRFPDPDIRIEIEGPKTPGDDLGVQTLMPCLIQNRWSRACAKTRELAITRHWNSLIKIKPTRAAIQWFDTASNQAQGFLLSVRNAQKEITRAVLITPSGAHQTLTLTRSSSAAGQEAQHLFTQILGSLHVLDELKTGRAIADRTLTQISLKPAVDQNNPLSRIQSLALIQSRLLAKISVDSREYDAFFHFGGTSLLMAQNAQSLTQKQTSVGDAQSLLNLNEIVAGQKRNLESAFQYARDIRPNDPRTGQIERMLLEIQKL